MQLIPVAEFETTVHHEAGHALVGVVLGIRVLYATIQPQGGVRGHVQYYEFDSPERELICTLAGPVAASLHKGTHYRSPAANRSRWNRLLPTDWHRLVPKTWQNDLWLFVDTTDQMIAERIARKLARGGSVRAVLDAATVRAEEILWQNRAGFRRVCNALVRYGTIREAHLMRLVKGGG